MRLHPTTRGVGEPADWAAALDAARRPAAPLAVHVGLGRTIALHPRASTSYQMRLHIRCLCFKAVVAEP
jgi:hypothetical protein